MSDAGDEHLNPGEGEGEASRHSEAPLLNPHTLESVRYVAREIVEGPCGENWVTGRISGGGIICYLSYSEPQDVEVSAKCSISLFSYDENDEDLQVRVADFSVDEVGLRFDADPMGTQALREGAGAATDNPTMSSILALLDHIVATDETEDDQATRLSALAKSAIYAAPHDSFDLLPQTELEDGSDVSVVRRPTKQGVPIIQVVHRVSEKVESYMFDPEGALHITEIELRGDDPESVAIEQYAFPENMPEGVETYRGFGNQNRAEQVADLLWRASDELGEL